MRQEIDSPGSFNDFNSRNINFDRQTAIEIYSEELAVYRQQTIGNTSRAITSLLVSNNLQQKEQK